MGNWVALQAVMGPWPWASFNIERPQRATARVDHAARATLFAWNPAGQTLSGAVWACTASAENVSGPAPHTNETIVPQITRDHDQGKTCG